MNYITRIKTYHTLSWFLYGKRNTLYRPQIESILSDQRFCACCMKPEPRDAPAPGTTHRADLLAWLGYSQRGRLEDRLRTLGVPIIYGRDGRICTTLGARAGRCMI